jgi:opacity protein-like surface antigen
MKKMLKTALAAAMLSSAAVAAAAPADAGVAVGIGIGVPGPGYHRHWCYNHPGACGPAYVAPAVVVGGPAIGVYVGGRGYWDGHRYWGHRYWGHGGWRYR